MTRSFTNLLRSLLFASIAVLPACAAEKKTKAAPTTVKRVADDDDDDDRQGGASGDVSGPPDVGSGSIMVVDASNGKVLYERNADARRPVASTQKVMTALIVAEAGNLSKRVTFQSVDTRCEPTKLFAKPGDTYSRGKLLSILLVKSMNDVARALARDHSGSIAEFAATMNAKARSLGMNNTNFVNPNGLTESGQYSTARDMTRLALHAYRNKTVRSIVQTRSLTWQNADGSVKQYDNTNKVLKLLPACNGMKTGYTEAAGWCLISSAYESGRHVICVILGDAKYEIWRDSNQALRWALGQ